VLTSVGLGRRGAGPSGEARIPALGAEGNGARESGPFRHGSARDSDTPFVSRTVRKGLDEATPISPANRARRLRHLDLGEFFMHDTCMATKTITIDMEAYEALRRRKGKGDSFSDVIKKHFGRGVTGRELEVVLGELDLGEDVLDAADELIRERRSHPARAPEL